MTTIDVLLCRLARIVVRKSRRSPSTNPDLQAHHDNTLLFCESRAIMYDMMRRNPCALQDETQCSK